MINTRSHVTTNSAYPILVISLCACFLFYKYVLQVFPSIITNQLMQEFHLTGAGLGNLAATFYYAYMITQLCVGVLLDKFSPRWLTSAAILTCSLGVIIFSHAHTVFDAGLSRALMGAGVAFATVAYMKLASIWFSAKKYALVSGLLATAAMSGAVFGQAPLAWLVNQYDWRTCLFFIGLIGCGLAFIFFSTVKDKSENIQKKIAKNHTSLNDILGIFKNKQNWLLTFYSGLAFSPVAVFGGLWGNPFLEQAYHLSKTEAASMVSLVFIGLGIGSPILGLISERLGNRRNVMLLNTLLSCIAVSMVLYIPSMPISVVSALLFLFGFGLGSFMLVFAMGKEMNSIHLTATVIATFNTCDAALSALTEPFIGKLLDLTWDGKIINGTHFFPSQSYKLALSVLPVYLIIGAVLLLWVKETQNNRSLKF